MNILILNPILYTADNNKIPKVNSIKDCMIYNMALGLKNLGHDITLLAAKEYQPVREEAYDFNVLFLKSHFPKVFLPEVLPLQLGLWKYLRKNKEHFDLIISSETFSFSSFFASVIAPGKTLIWHELTGHNNKFHQIPSKLWYNVIARMFMSKTLVVGRSGTAKEFISKYLKNVSGIWVDHGVNIEKFKYSMVKKSNFIVVSQLIARKNISSIIIKYAKFIQRWEQYKNIKLLIAGRGEEEAALKKRVADLNLGFLPHSELNKYVSESYASLIDTKRDLNIVSIPESIVSGTPVVTNMVSPLASFINSNKLGIAQKEWDEYALDEIVKNNALYVNNCVMFRNEMSNESASKKMVNIFESKQKFSKIN